MFFTPLFKHLENLVVNSWWAFAILLLCYAAYEQVLREHASEFTKLDALRAHLQDEQRRALAWQQDLLLQINSQSDQDWIELTLVKGLGVVPEDQIKVLFAPKDDSKEANPAEAKYKAEGSSQ